jgi:hypothetical protein
MNLPIHFPAGLHSCPGKRVTADLDLAMGDEVLQRDRAAGSGLAGRNTQGKQVEQAAVTAGVTVVENYLYAS